MPLIGRLHKKPKFVKKEGDWARETGDMRY